MPNQQRRDLCEYGTEHEWRPAVLDSKSPDAPKTSGWFVQECSRCGKIKWVRKHLDDILD